MLQNAYLLAKIGADTAENERNFAENLPKIGNYPTGPLPLVGSSSDAVEMRILARAMNSKWKSVQGSLTHRSHCRFLLQYEAPETSSQYLFSPRNIFAVFCKCFHFWMTIITFWFFPRRRKEASWNIFLKFRLHSQEMLRCELYHCG